MEAAYFILDAEGRPQEVKGLGALMNWMREHSTIVQQTLFSEGTMVSTVFLGINVQIAKGRPLIFETMIFSERLPSLDTESKRAPTMPQALEYHESMVELLKLAMPEGTTIRESYSEPVREGRGWG